MKKILLIICFFLTSLNGTQAQETFLWGVKGGVNFSRLNFNEFNTDYRTAYHFGILTEFPIVEKFSFQPEILYSSQGAESSDAPSFDGPALHVFQLDYLQIPLTLKYNIFKGMALEAGPSFNFLLKERITSTYFGMPMTDTSTNEYAKFFELGGLLGLSYKLPGNFFLSTRFIYGLTNAFNGKGFSTTHVTNYGFQIGTGYIF